MVHLCIVKLYRVIRKFLTHLHFCRTIIKLKLSDYFESFGQSELLLVNSDEIIHFIAEISETRIILVNTVVVTLALVFSHVQFPLVFSILIKFSN